MLKIVSISPLARTKVKQILCCFFLIAGFQPSYGQADLVIQSPSTFTNTVNAGRGIYLSSTIANLGNASATSSTISFYLSTNNALDASDVLLSNSAGRMLAAGASVLNAETPTIPLNTVAGNYFILLVADNNNEVAESNETNNVTSIAITVTTLPDLFLSSASLLEIAASPGGTISVGGSIFNVGLFPSNSSNLGYYLSTNNTLDASDILLGTSTGGSLAGGSIVTLTATLTIPGNTVPSNYFIIYVADYTNTVVEVEETNNQSYKVFYVTGATTQPDLVINNVSCPSSTIETGKSTSINGKILNQGNATANPNNIGIYLSVNSTLESTDILLATKSGQTLSPGTESNLQAEVSIPVNIAPGTYFILVKADNNNEITESNETNNVSSLPIVVLSPEPDLRIKSLAINVGTIVPGGIITATATITNIGSGELSASKINYYLSVDNRFENTDILLGESVIKLLTPNSTAELTVNLTIPTTTATGNYYIVMVFNNTTVINEKDEPNNEAVNALRVSTPTGINDLATDYTISVSPNPTPDKVNIQIVNLKNGVKAAEITLYNANGAKVLSSSAKVATNKVATTMDVRHLVNGIYILYIQVGDAFVTQRIVIEKN